MLTCVQIQLKGFSREIEEQVKPHEAYTSKKKSNAKDPLKKSAFY